MTKRKLKRAPFNIRWALLEVALEYLFTGKLPRPKARKFKKMRRN